MKKDKLYKLYDYFYSSWIQYNAATKNDDLELKEIIKQRISSATYILEELDIITTQESISINFHMLDKDLSSDNDVKRCLSNMFSVNVIVYPEDKDIPF